MTPLDYRNDTFADLQGRLVAQRARVFAAWQAHGPCTTEQLAERSGISVLNVRPRTHELLALGFVVLVDEIGAGMDAARRRAASGGIYRARTYFEHQAWFTSQQRDARPGQRELVLQ